MKRLRPALRENVLDWNAFTMGISRISATRRERTSLAFVAAVVLLRRAQAHWQRAILHRSSCWLTMS
jgi:hypothetical protein